MNASIPSVIFDEHASVLPHWFSRGYRERTVVCFDAHLDLQCISRRRIDAFRVASSAQSLTDLAKPHHLIPDSMPNGRSFSYGIEDFYYAASQIGIVNHLVWVAPPYVLSGGVGMAVEQLQQVDGVTLEDLESFRRRHPTSEPMCWIEGDLLGLKLTVCDESALQMIPLPSDSIVDIDIDYFVELPSEKIGVDPVESISLVRNLDIDLQEVTISRSVRSGFTPLAYCHLAELIRDLFHAPSIDNWSAWPISRLVGDQDRDPLRMACEALVRGKHIDSKLIESLMCSFGDLEECPGLLWSAIGLLWCQHDRPDQAEDAYRQCKESLGPHPELALELGKAFSQRAEHEKAIAYLSDALLDDKTNTSARLEISVALIRQSIVRQSMHESPAFTTSARLDVTIEHLRAATVQCPAWDVAWSLLGKCYAMVGDQDLAQHHNIIADEIQSRVNRCVQGIQ